MVGDGERLQPLLGRLGDQVFGAGCPVEEAVRRMAVQFSPGGPWLVSPGRLGRTGRQAGGRPRLAVVAVVVIVAVVLVGVGAVVVGWAAFAALAALGAVAGPGQPPFELPPRQRWIVPAHDVPRSSPLLFRWPAAGSLFLGGVPAGYTGWMSGATVYFRPAGVVQVNSPGRVCSSFHRGCCLS